MYIKAFKINEVNINVKLLFTKSEAIALCKKGKHKVRKVLLQHLAEKLMDIEDVSKIVGEDHIQFPQKVEISMLAPQQLFSESDNTAESNEPGNT